MSSLSSSFTHTGPRPLTTSMAPAARRTAVACRASQIDLVEKSSPIHRTALGAFELAARATGVSWHSHAEAQKLLPELQKNMAKVQNPQLAAPSDYPAYVLEPGLHGYPHGNLHANSSLDAESAVTIFNSVTMGDPLHPVRANKIWRTTVTESAATYYAQTHADAPQDIVDLCCGTGASSAHLRAAFPQATILAIDASPMHIAEAMRTGPANVTWKHNLAGDTGLPDASQDLVTMTATTHETPLDEADKIFREALRILRPGGVFALTDVPQFKGVRSPFNVMYDLLERFDIEPNLAGFRSADYPQRLTDAGFTAIDATNPGVPCLHVLGRKA